MSETIHATTFALQDILLGLAEGLNEAQQQLREQQPYDAFGRPNTMYQLPYLDFQLQVTSEFESVTSGDANESKNLLRFQPARPVTTGTTARMEIFSTISGRFVATLPNEGAPQTVIRISTETPQLTGVYYEVKMNIEIGNAAGEKLSGVVVEINFDVDTMQLLNGVPHTTTPELPVGEVITGTEGKASAIVRIAKADFTSGKFTVISANTGPVIKTISISNNSGQ